MSTLRCAASQWVASCFEQLSQVVGPAADGTMIQRDLSFKANNFKEAFKRVEQVPLSLSPVYTHTLALTLTTPVLVVMM